MCTLTWFVKKDGYELFFNRDERVSRRRADVPSVHYYDNVECLLPIDADAGGTWIAANQYGTTVCLLNHYQYEQLETYKAWVSRGEMVRKFSATSDLKQAKQQFNALDLSDYRAFRMFIITRNGDNLLCVWDGHSARIESDVVSPKSSSSVDAKHVKLLRKQLFCDMNLASSKNTHDYLQYHCSHVPSASKESVCMHRSDGNTVSLSHVSVSSAIVSFRYADGNPCVAQLGADLSINVVKPRDAHTIRPSAV